MSDRKIRKIVTGSASFDGAGVRLVRVIGHADVKDFDPFLMMDAFDSENPADYTKGFPWHPHRGIETVTYLVAGDIEHGDSLGNKGSIFDGGCQWMTAGSGIIHQEMPTKPKYRDLTAEKIPAVNGTGSRVSVIAGSFGDTAGAMRGEYVEATMLDIGLDAGASVDIPVPSENTVFVYIFDGTLTLGSSGDRQSLDRRRAVLLTDGDTVTLAAPESGGARCVLFSGAPLREPVAWGGPIVMNTREELNRAFAELDEGTFIK